MIAAIAELFFSAIATIRASVEIVAIIWKPGFKLPVSLRQVADIMYQSIIKLPMPPRRPLGIWLFLKGFGQIPGYVGSLDGQIPHRLPLQKVSNPALHQRKNFRHASNRLFKSKFPPTQPKYLKARKTVLRRFVHSNNIVHFKKPTFNGLFQATCKRTQCWELMANNVAPTMLRAFARSFKGSLMLQQNSEYRNNDVNNPWTWCTRWKKSWPIFWHESQCPTGRASFWVKFPTVRKNAGGMPGEWEVLELTCTKSNPC